MNNLLLMSTEKVMCIDSDSLNLGYLDVNKGLVMGNLRIYLNIILVLALFTSSSLMVNHSFMWGVEVGDRFDFIIKIGYSPRQMELDQREILLNLKIYMQVTDLIDLSDPVADSSIWYVTNMFMEADIFLSNGTSFSTIDLDVYQLLEGAAAIPIGNWSLLNEIIDTTNEDMGLDYTYTVIDESDYWGYSFEDSFMDSSETWKWSKTDGSLHSVNVVNSSHEKLPYLMALDFTVERTGSSQSFLIYLGLGVSLLVIAVLVVFLRKR